MIVRSLYEIKCDTEHPLLLVLYLEMVQDNMSWDLHFLLFDKVAKQPVKAATPEERSGNRQRKNSVCDCMCV